MNFDTQASIMRRMGKPVEFAKVPLLAMFESNGNVWQKVTTRTATGHWPAILPNRAYFRKNETCYMESKQ